MTNTASSQTGTTRNVNGVKTRRQWSDAVINSIESAVDTTGSSRKTSCAIELSPSVWLSPSLSVSVSVLALSPLPNRQVDEREQAGER
ncbi:MAG: hypothetical protein J07HX64_02514 [halophilic archaeon J07HX64]|nr:MAG: hypothetical protein J07HX64_02514 [halophilic archaeon J07HX64]